MAAKSKKSTAKKSHKTGVAVGVGLTAASIAAIGGYFLYGSKNAAKNRKKAKSWMLKAKAEVLEGIEDVKDLTEEEYHELVDAVTKGYKKARKVSASELADFKKDMEAHWKDIERSAAGKKVINRAKRVMHSGVKAATKAKKRTKKAAKKTKKTVKKAAKKASKKK